METSDKPKGTAPGGDDAAVRTGLFNRHVLPHLNLVYKLCVRYSHCPSEIDDNYSEALINFYRYIGTYDARRPVQTWLHIVTKRYIQDLNRRREPVRRTQDVDIRDIADSCPDRTEAGGNSMDAGNYREFYNDDILEALERLKPIYREALLLQLAGYRLSEIMEACFRKGTLKMRNIETIKSRLFLAKQQMRKMIDRNGDARED